VENGNQLVVTGLTPGTYDLGRSKLLRVGDLGKGLICDRLTVVLEAGKTQKVTFVRKNAQLVRGEVLGLRDAQVAGAFITVRSADATGDPRNLKELMQLFDALTCDQNGNFHTAALEPGTYTVVAEAYTPEPRTGVMSTGVRLPAYLGVAKITIAANAPPPPLQIELRPRAGLSASSLLDSFAGLFSGAAHSCDLERPGSQHSLSTTNLRTWEEGR
jgi:hypothetical protein